MKILFLSRLYHPHIGGVEKHVKKISKELMSGGHEVTVITEKFQKDLENREIIDGVEVIRISYPHIKLIGLFVIWLKLLRLRTKFVNAGIVHIHDIVSWYWPYKLLFPKKDIFTTFHGRWGVYPVASSDKIQKKIGARLSKGIICIGDYIPKHYGIRADVVSYGAIDVPASKIKRKIEKLVIYVGRLDKDIALDVIFKVFTKLGKFNIEICGSGELEKEAQKFGKVHGFVDPTPYYKKAKYCFTSGYLTILEALSNGCLVFSAYNNPLQKDYYKLAPFDKFIVTSSNYRFLLNKLLYYSGNNEAAQRRVENGFKWVRSQTWKKLTSQYIKLWEKKL